MSNNYTLHEDAWYSDEEIRPGRQIIGYRVAGMPDGKWARIANWRAPYGNDWQVVQISADNKASEWTGHYESAKDALADLP